MKRDMDLIRKILINIEEAPFDGGWVNLSLEGYQDAEVSYHVLLLNEAGLVDAIDLSSMSGIDWKPRRLTWSGHEFMEAARDEKRWEKAKSIIKEKSGGFVFDVFKGLLIELMKTAVFGQ